MTFHQHQLTTKRLEKLGGTIKSWIAAMTSTIIAEREYPSPTTREFLINEMKMFDKNCDFLNEEQKDQYLAETKPLYNKFQEMTVKPKVELENEQEACPFSKNAYCEQLKDIIRAEIERNTQNYAILETNTYQFSMVNQEQHEFEKTLRRSSRHIRTLQQIQLTEDFLERIVKGMFIFVCMHICLSRLGVYWILYITGIQSIPGYVWRIKMRLWSFLIHQVSILSKEYGKTIGISTSFQMIYSKKIACFMMKFIQLLLPRILFI